MNRTRRALVAAIIGMAILGFGLITAVEAVKPPFMPPEYLGYPGYPDAVRIWPGWDGNVIYESDASWVLSGWAYYVDEAEPVDERELFPPPITVQLFIRSSGGDWCEIKLSRHAFGNAKSIDPHFVGPIHRWYAYFEPGYFDVGEYETNIQFTCKNPDNPKERMFCWDTDPTSPTYGMDLNWFGMLTVLDG
ncbi:MAG: hypothetical protein ACFFC0_04065 [Promethearchaeota archaeon]